MSSESEEVSRGGAAVMSPARLLKILLSHVGRHSARAGLLVLTLLIEGVFNVLLALSLKLIIDYAVTPRRPAVLAGILAALGVGFLLTAASQALRDYLYAWLGSHVIADVRAEMFRHLQRLSPAFYARARTGDLSARFSSDLAAVENAVVLGIPRRAALRHQHSLQRVRSVRARLEARPVRFGRAAAVHRRPEAAGAARSRRATF